MYSQPKFTIKTNISLIEVVSNQRFLPVSVDKSSRKLSRAIFLIMKGAKKTKSSFSNLERGSVDGVPVQTRRHDCLGERRAKSGRDPFQVWTKHCQGFLKSSNLLSHLDYWAPSRWKRGYSISLPNREGVKNSFFTVRLTASVNPHPHTVSFLCVYDLRLWLYVFWNRFYTRKKSFSSNFLNPQFFLTVHCSCNGHDRIAV